MEYAIAALAVALVALLLLRRRAPPRTAPSVDPAAEARLAATREAAVQAVRSLVEPARETLEASAKDGATVTEAARRAVEALEADQDPELARAEAELRAPLLVTVRGDDEALRRLAEPTDGDDGGAASAPPLRERAEDARRELDALVAAVSTDGERVWSIPALVAIAVELRGDHAPSDAELRARLRRAPEPAPELERAFDLAWALLETWPASRREVHEGILAPAIDDLALSAAMIRQAAGQADDAPVAARARLIVRGDFGDLWLAYELARELPFTDAASAFRELAPLARARASARGDASERRLAEAVERLGLAELRDKIEARRSVEADGPA